MSKSHLSIRIDAEDKAALETLARTLDVSVGQLARRALKQALAAGGIPGAKPADEVRHLESSVPNRERELAWLERQAGQLPGLAGEYLVIDGDELVAHGLDYLKVLDEARRRGVRIPFVVRVPEHQEGYSIGL